MKNYNNNSSFGEEKNCVQCDTPFFIPEKQLEWYKEKGFETPKRCKECREARKKEMEDKKSKGYKNK